MGICPIPHPSQPSLCMCTHQLPKSSCRGLPGVVPGDGSHCHLFSAVSPPPELTSPRLQPCPLLSGFWALLHQDQTHCRSHRGLLAKQSQAQKPAQRAPTPTVPSPKGRTLPCSEGLSSHSGSETPLSFCLVTRPAQPSLCTCTHDHEVQLHWGCLVLSLGTGPTVTHPL